MPFRRLTSDLTCRTRTETQRLTNKAEMSWEEQSSPRKSPGPGGGGAGGQWGHDQQTLPLDLRKVSPRPPQPPPATDPHLLLTPVLLTHVWERHQGGVHRGGCTGPPGLPAPLWWGRRPPVVGAETQRSLMQGQVLPKSVLMFVFCRSDSIPRPATISPGTIYNRNVAKGGKHEAVQER